MHLDLADWAVLSPLIIVVTSQVMIQLERRFPYDRGQPVFRVGWFVDFFWYTLAQSYLLGLVIGALIQFIDTRTGLSRLHLVTSWPLWAQIGFFVVTHDFYIYCFHRLQHRNRWLWRTHEAHHSGKDVDWLAGSRSHSLEILINQTIDWGNLFGISGGIRSDYGSAFGAAYKAATFPRGTIYFRPSELMTAQQSWLRDWKIRGAYGAAGLQQAGG